MSEPTPKEPSRGPTNLRIKFRSASLEQFIERYAVDVSRGGIFIRTREPLAVGTRLKLEFQLQDSAPLLAGEGTVVWIREHDQTRENVTPGMGVRFDKLTTESQPTLEKILAEKTRLEQAGVAAVGQPKGGGGGMAVRRPSGVFASLDASARAALGASLPGGAENTATGPESTPIASPPPPSGSPPPLSAIPPIPKTSFLGSRAGVPAAPAQAGPFTRARTTTSRPVPVPSALFEPPTAADIDKALEALEEAPGPAPAPRPTPAAPRYVADDASNEPTRVADIIDELVGGNVGRGPIPGSMASPAAPMTERLAASAGASDRADAAAARASSLADAASPGGSTAALDQPLEISDVEVEPAVPEKQAVVQAPVAPDPSKRFRAASRAYPTLGGRRRSFTGLIVVAVILAGAAGAAIKLNLKDRFFPRHVAPPPVTEAQLPPPAPAAQIPAATAPATPPATPEGVGGSAGVAATPPAAPEKAAQPEKTAAPDKAATDEKKPSPAAAAETEEHGKRHPLRRHAEAAAPDKATAEKPAGDRPMPEQPAEAAADQKPAAAAVATAAPIVKITSTPSGAQVFIDGREVGTTPFLSKEIDPASPHAITVKKDGYEENERMVSGLDWSRPHGNSPQTLKVNAKLRRTAPAAAAPAEAAPAAPKENAEPQDTGGPYIKEVKPDSP